MVQPPLKTRLWLIKIINSLLLDPTNSILGRNIYKIAFIEMFIVALFIIAKNWKQPNFHW